MVNVPQPRNNNKAFPNLYFGMLDDVTATVTSVAFCSNCKLLTQNTSGAGLTKLLDHLLNEHGFTTGL